MSVRPDGLVRAPTATASGVPPFDAMRRSAPSYQASTSVHVVAGNATYSVVFAPPLSVVRARTPDVDTAREIPPELSVTSGGSCCELAGAARVSARARTAMYHDDPRR